MQTIGDHLGISKYSVSQALTGKPGVSDETREKVLAAAKSLGYRLVKPDAQNAEQSSSAYILVWIDERQAKEPLYWGRVLSGIAAGCKEMQWNYVVTSPQPAGKLIFPQFLNRETCLGHLIVGSMSTGELASIYQMGLPLVLIDHKDSLIEADSVFNDNTESAQSMVNHLLHTGRRSFLFIGDDSYAISFKERWLGCKQAVEDFGGKASGCSLRKISLPYKDPGRNESLEKKIRLLFTDQQVDAFICVNDHIALELIQLLKALHIDIPLRCAVVGFDNIEQSAYMDPPLTTVELSKETLGFRGVEQLSRRRLHPGTLAERIALSTRLVIRHSG
jgi:LacI family transcriptional regulator